MTADDTINKALFCQHRAKGFSLVEIMIALVLGLLLTGGIIQIYISSQQSYRLNEGQSRLQESARFALEFLTRDIRMSGYMGCVSRSVSITNTLNTPTAYLYNFSVPVQGFEWNEATNVWLPAVDGSITSHVNGSDIITVRKADEQGSTVTDHPGGSPPGSADIKFSGTPLIEKCDIVVVSDCEAAAIFLVTNFTAANNNTVHNTGANPSCSPSGPQNATKELGKSYVGGQLISIKNISFYIGNNPNGQPALFRKVNSNIAEELVEGVEQMEILYGIDTSLDGVANQYVTANIVGSWNTVVSVRINLLMRSIEANLITQQPDFTFNDVNVPVADRRLRRIFTTTISIRNRLR